MTLELVFLLTRLETVGAVMSIDMKSCKYIML